MKSEALLCLTLCIWLQHLTVPCWGEGLKCYLCLSHKSWKDCEKKKQLRSCYPLSSEVCVKQYMVEHSNGTEKSYKETFVKMCGEAKLCTDKSCKEEGKYCHVHCCHEDYCNSASKPGTRSTSIMLNAMIFTCGYLAL